MPSPSLFQALPLFFCACFKGLFWAPETEEPPWTRLHAPSPSSPRLLGDRHDIQPGASRLLVPLRR
ncbi:hypothetical protein CCHR01_12284 [Colletotrichum chrysophilum]|uniref:Secreted protein n=1 Tax=Colletotrichum chrysophilum TaxID=1836956 RepID=A0AAD9ADP2_9PEZI|nr:hypothetical protein CCHR01_12284 [Colletotrichum chrysophilum]